MDRRSHRHRWDRLDELHVPRDVTVTVHVKNVSLAQTLRAVVHDLDSQGYHNVDFDACDGMIRISESQSLLRVTQTEFFNARPLLIRLNGAASPSQPAGRDSAELADELISLILQNVDPVNWRANGGINGQIREIGGLLVVTQTPENLHSIQRLLNVLT